jgi:hypothetical protein
LAAPSDSTVLLDWLRAVTTGWKPSAVGIFRADAPYNWPLHAAGATELQEQLTLSGHLLPLPSEPAALANVMEMELRQHIHQAAAALEEVEVADGTERSYPDIEFSGTHFGGGFRAVDIKCARRANPGKSGKNPTALNNRIALYTGNTYFLWPELKFGGIMRPFGSYLELLSIVVIYTFRADLPKRIADVQVVVHPTWRIAARARASTTREYIGSIQDIARLVAGSGDFETADDFYAYWRHSTRNWKKSPEAERLLRQVVKGLTAP